MPLYPYKDGFVAYDINNNAISYINEEIDFRETPNRINNIQTHDVLNEYQEITLVFITTYECNFKCLYCYEAKGESNLTVKHKSEKFNAESMMQVYLSFLKQFSSASFNINFFGGEPFVEQDAIIEFIQMADKYNEENNIKPLKYNAITNGSLLDEKICKLIINRFSGLTISLDGIKNIHDKNRIFENGEGTFNLIQKNLKILQNMNSEKKVKVACEATLTNDFFAQNNSPKVINDNYNLFKEYFNEVGIVPVSDIVPPLDFTHPHVEQVVSSFLDLWVQDILNLQQPANIASFNNIIAGFTGKNKFGYECSAGINYFAISPDMIIYPCQMSTFSDKLTMGSIGQLSNHMTLDRSRINHYTKMTDNPLCNNCECESTVKIVKPKK